jgi:hypothetical protein
VLLRLEGGEDVLELWSLRHRRRGQLTAPFTPPSWPASTPHQLVTVRDCRRAHLTAPFHRASTSVTINRWFNRRVLPRRRGQRTEWPSSTPAPLCKAAIRKKFGNTSLSRILRDFPFDAPKSIGVVVWVLGVRGFGAPGYPLSRWVL